MPKVHRTPTEHPFRAVKSEKYFLWENINNYTLCFCSSGFLQRKFESPEKGDSGFCRVSAVSLLFLNQQMENGGGILFFVFQRPQNLLNHNGSVQEIRDTTFRKSCPRK